MVLLDSSYRLSILNLQRVLTCSSSRPRRSETARRDKFIPSRSSTNLILFRMKSFSRLTRSSLFLIAEPVLLVYDDCFWLSESSFIPEAIKYCCRYSRITK